MLLRKVQMHMTKMETVAYSVFSASMGGWFCGRSYVHGRQGEHISQAESIPHELHVATNQPAASPQLVSNVP